MRSGMIILHVLQTTFPTALVTTVGDELKLATNSKAKVIGVSYKDRAAILPGGKMADAAYWYDTATGNFISSTCYMSESPDWVRSFNEAKIPDSYFGKQWRKLLAEDAYELSREDDFPHELDYKGLGVVFPHTTAVLTTFQWISTKRLLTHRLRIYTWPSSAKPSWRMKTSVRMTSLTCWRLVFPLPTGSDISMVRTAWSVQQGAARPDLAS